MRRSPAYDAILFDAIFNQFASDFNVEWEWRAGTQFRQPLSADRIRKSLKAEYRNVHGVSFAGRGVFYEVTPASRTMMLDERLAGFDFDLTPASARPFVAVPDVAIHVNGLLLRKLCGVTDGNVVIAQLQGKERFMALLRFEPVPISSGPRAAAERGTQIVDMRWSNKLDLWPQ